MERSPVAKGRAGATEIISDLVVFAILSVSTALVLQVIPKQEQNPSDGGRYPPIGLEPGTPITLQEAGAKAAFTPLVPEYLPESLSLRRVTGLPGLQGLHENDGLYGEVRLFYSD